MTVADVAKEAGLSAGIVIFHFNSKEELLGAVLEALAAEYRNHWEASMKAAGPSAAARLQAMLLSDFDTERQAATEALCSQIIAEGHYGLDPQLIMRGLESLGDGLWISLGGGGYKGQVSGTQAKHAMAAALAAFFPKHYVRPA